MSLNATEFSPITGLHSVVSDSISTHALSTITFDVETLETDTLDNFNNATITLKSTIIPDITSVYNLGSTSLRFNDIFSDTLDATTLTITDLDVDGLSTLDETRINTTDGDFKVWDGATSSLLITSAGLVDINSIRFSSANIGLSTDTDLLALADNSLTVNGVIDISTGNDYQINSTSVLNATTLGSGVVSSSLTSTGALNSGSITSGFGSINNGSSALTTGAISCSSIINTGDVTADSLYPNATDTYLIGNGSLYYNQIFSLSYNGRGWLRLFNLTNDGNPYVSIGNSLTEGILIKSFFDSGTTNLDYVEFRTSNASAAANKGQMKFLVDDAAICDLYDNGINLKTGKELYINDVSVLNATTLGSSVVNSSLTSVGTIASGVWNASNITSTYIDTGIADNKIVKIDSASVNAAEYAKFTANGLESKTFGEVKSDLSLNLVENTALSTWAGSSNLVTVGALDSGSITANFGNIDNGVSTINSGVIVSTANASTDSGLKIIPESADANNAGCRVFFKEAATDALYGVSIGYNGINNNSILNWGANSFNISRHNNSANGVVVLNVSRASDIINTVNIYPLTNSTYDLGSTSFGWNKIFSDAYNIGANIVLSGTTLGSSIVTSSLTTVSTLDSGSISSGFGNIDNGVSTINSGVIVSTANSSTDSGLKIIPSYTDTSNAGCRLYFKEQTANSNYGFSIGFNGEASNSILNWPENTFNICRHSNNGTGVIVFQIHRDSDIITFVANILPYGPENTIGSSSDNWNYIYADNYNIGANTVLSGTTLGSSIVTSSLTSTGALNSGSISSGFGNIDIGSSTIDSGNLNCSQCHISVSGIDSGIKLIPQEHSWGDGGRIHFKELSTDSLYGISMGYNGGADNSILNWKANTFNINTHPNNATGTTVFFIDRDIAVIRTSDIRPLTDDNNHFGTGSLRWNEIFCTNSTINTSDRLLKTNIKQIPMGLSFINKLNPVEYTWISNSHDRKHLGLIAQDVGNVLDSTGFNKKKYSLYIDDEYRHQKECADLDKQYSSSNCFPERKKSTPEISGTNKHLKGLRYTEFIPILIKGIQDLHAIVLSNQDIIKKQQLQIDSLIKLIKK